MMISAEPTAQRIRNAEEEFGDDGDHAHIRGLGAAFHWAVARVLRSNIGDHRADAHIARPMTPSSVLEHRVTRALSARL